MNTLNQQGPSLTYRLVVSLSRISFKSQNLPIGISFLPRLLVIVTCGNAPSLHIIQAFPRLALLFQKLDYTRVFPPLCHTVCLSLPGRGHFVHWLHYDPCSRMRNFLLCLLLMSAQKAIPPWRTRELQALSQKRRKRITLYILMSF